MSYLLVLLNFRFILIFQISSVRSTRRPLEIEATHIEFDLATKIGIQQNASETYVGLKKKKQDKADENNLESQKENHTRLQQ